MNYNNEINLLADRMQRIKMQIKYIEDKINLNKSIISKFEELPSNIKKGIDENMNGKSFKSIYYRDINIYSNQLNTLYKSLKELEK